MVNQGEKGFYKVAKKFYDFNHEIPLLKASEIPGFLANNVENNKYYILNTCKDHILVGENFGTLDDLNEIITVPKWYARGIL